MKKLVLMLVTLLAISSVFALVACGKESYTVTFDSDGGTTIEALTIEEGSLITLDTTPTKASDNTYTYTFGGWYEGENLVDLATYTVSANVELKAKWVSTYINYIVVFNDEDGTELLKKEDYHYGDTIVEPETTPTKEADEYQTYTFSSWDETVGTVDGNLTFTAVYTATAAEGYSTHDLEVSGDAVTLKAGKLRREGDSLDGRVTGGNLDDISVNQAYLGIDGNFGLNSYVAFEFTGKNMPILAFFAENYNQSMYTGPLTEGHGSKKGVVILTGITNNDGELIEGNPNGSTYMWDGKGILQCGPDMLYWTDRESGEAGYYYNDNINSPYHARVGGGVKDADCKDVALGRANLVDGTHYRVIIGNSLSNKSLVTTYYLYNIDTNELVETKSVTSYGFFTEQFCQGSLDEYFTGSIVLYGYFGVDTVIDKIYPVFEDTTAAYVDNFFNNTYKVTADGNTITLGAGTLSEEAVLKGPIEAGECDLAYYGFGGEYGKNSYVTLEFTGKNMPNIAFFAKNFNNSIYTEETTKEGILICTGLTNNDGTLYADPNANGSTDIHDGKGLVMFGPYMMYCTDNEVGNNKRLRESKMSLLARANLEDDKKYRVVIGMKEGTDYRSIAVEYYLYNITDSVMVECGSLQSWNFFADSFCVDRNTYFTGDIVLYGQFGTTVTLDKVYEVATDTTLQAVVESYGMTYPETVTDLSSTKQS